MPGVQWKSSAQTSYHWLAEGWSPGNVPLCVVCCYAVLVCLPAETGQCEGPAWAVIQAQTPPPYCLRSCWLDEGDDDDDDGSHDDEDRLFLPAEIVVAVSVAIHLLFAFFRRS